MANGKISNKQREILEYLKSEILSRGFPPSVREICEAVNLKSTSSVHAHLESLEKNGYIRKDATKPRAIEIIDDDFREKRLQQFMPSPDVSIAEEYVNVPVIGRVSAGTPLLAVENITDYIPIPMGHMPNTQTFLLRVKGESMVNAGILDGDYVLVRQKETASDGDMIVALVDDSATVKTFYREDGYIRLQPENDFMDPIIVSPDQHFQILGDVIAVMRFFL